MYSSFEPWRYLAIWGASEFSNGHLMTHFYSGSSVMLPNHPVATVTLSSNGLWWHHIVTNC
jgi:hypothetical protein